MKSKGVVYILTNPSYPSDILKIGMTRRSAEIRAQEIYEKATGVPEPFVVAHQVDVVNCVVAEEMVHSKLNQYRGNKNREFFKISLKKAVEIVNDIAKKIDSLYSELPLKEHDSSTEKATINKKYKKESIYRKCVKNPWASENKLKRTESVSVNCGKCNNYFNVTLIRYENKARCSKCFFLNDIKIEW